jgi:hypothetical protein
MQDLNYSTSTTTIEDIDRTVRHDNNTASTGIDELRRILEHAIAGYPFTQVIATLAKVCHAQANHIRSTTVDEHLAQAWEFNARQCERVTRAALSTTPTIEIRSVKIGIAREELQRRIDRLPEPLRVFAMDWVHGALPPSGRSSAMHAWHHPRYRGNV